MVRSAAVACSPRRTTRTSRDAQDRSNRDRANRPLPSSSIRPDSHACAKITPSAVDRAGLERVPGLLGQQLCDVHQIAGAVAGEGDPGAEPRGQARVAAHEPVHVVRVAREHDDQPVAVVLGPLEQRLDRLGAVRVTAGVPVVVQRVGLVDEQDAAHRGVDELVRLDRGRPEVLADQVGAVGLD